MNKLETIHISQKGVGAEQHGNDCGAACGLMAARYFGRMNTWTVDTFYEAANPTNEDIYLNMDAIESVLNGKGVETERTREGAKIGNLFTALVEGKPCICLVSYATIQDNNLAAPDTNFRGAHFVLVNGMDIREVSVHDPLRSDVTTWPIEVLETAWYAVSRDPDWPNPANAFIACHAEKFTEAGQTDTGRVLCTSLILRAGPGSNFVDLAYMHEGDEVTILGTQEVEDQTWANVRYRSKVGWCCAISGPNYYLYGV